MKSKIYKIFIVFILLLLIGFVGLQLYWMNRAQELTKTNFKRNVDDAVNIALLKLESLFIKQYNLCGDNHEINMSDSSVFKNFHKDTLRMPKETDSTFINNFMIRRQQIRNTIKANILKSHNSIEYNIEQYISVGLIDTLINNELLAKGINIPYYFGVYQAKQNKLVLLNSPDAEKENLIETGFYYPLFTGLGFYNQDLFVIKLENEKKAIFSNLWSMLVLSIIMIFMLIAAFIAIMHIVMKQEKLSVMKNDFINNMTHEFKTPISTIMLTCQVLTDKTINIQPEVHDNYLKIISDESKRLGELSEKILQSSLIEKDTLSMNYREINIHEIITDAIQKISIQIEVRDGTIEQNLAAKNPVIMGDKTYLSNVISNLLDNANKYSPRKPVITVETQNTPTGIVISVSDKGMGISKANQKRIFDRLYRVSTGDVHDVKGFGLGLSYVKMIVQKHKGEITVDSEINKGSCFKIYLPFYH